MSKAQAPELKKFMDKKIIVTDNCKHRVEGVLQGFDPFMNVVLDEAVVISKDGSRNEIGITVIRGSSILMIEAPDQKKSESVC